MFIFLNSITPDQNHTLTLLSSGFTQNKAGPSLGGPPYSCYYPDNPYMGLVSRVTSSPKNFQGDMPDSGDPVS
jgi:hypothetical protein